MNSKKRLIGILGAIAIMGAVEGMSTGRKRDNFDLLSHPALNHTGYPPSGPDKETIKAKGLQQFNVNGIMIWAKTEANAHYNYSIGKY